LSRLIVFVLTANKMMLNLGCWRTTNRVFPKVKDLGVFLDEIGSKK
jgi:hypothetical protein